VFGAFLLLQNGSSCFCFICFNSRSRPVPYCGERLKQGTVHSLQIAIITSQRLGAYCNNSKIACLIWQNFFATSVRQHPINQCWRNFYVTKMIDILIGSKKTQQ